MTDIATTPAAKPPLLCLDDEADNLDALERIFRKSYTVLKAVTPEQAFSYLDQYPDLTVIISDQKMPQITGVEFLEQSIKTHPETMRILLTGYADIESVIGAVNQGQIYRYLTKPWDPTDLLTTVNQAHERYFLKTQLKQKNEQLEKALTELQMLDKTKSQFMILINHELKTPLTSILSFASLLKETSLSDEQKLFTERIIKSSEKLKNIVEDVLVIVKGEMGLIKIHKEKFKFDEFLKELPPETSHMLKFKNQTTTTDFKVPIVNTDASLLKTALHRVLHNATKFGQAQSTIKINSFHSKAGFVAISIENQGPQITAQVIDKILKPFMLDENVMNHSAGMGLGLTICQTLIKALKGDLEISNTSNGVKITFHLPEIS